jgi:hypothetical protein
MLVYLLAKYTKFRILVVAVLASYTKDAQRPKIHFRRLNQQNIC